jgi:glycosyltransferase involved in cell wall biosynthesis
MPYVVSRDGPPDRSLRARLQVPDEATVFLYIFDASSYLERKNPRALIEAFIAEFGDDGAAALVIKLSYGDSGSTELGAIRAACRARANIRLMEGVMPEGDILRLIDAADCYVSPHRSEGFGLTIAEAMLRAKPVIATGYAGPADYLSEATGFPISFTLSEIQQDIGPYAKGHVWAEPRHDHLRQLMRRVTLNRAEAEARALAGQACIRQRFSAAAVGLAMQSRLDEIWQGQRQVDNAVAERL